MNCDQVFDILTRGPFPTGTSCDLPVEAHLTICPECGRLADALRPALELFQEAIGPEESRDLPGYWSGVATERTQQIVAYVDERRPAPRGISLEQASQLAHTWRIVAALVFGIALGTLASWRSAEQAFSFSPATGGGMLMASAGDDSRHDKLNNRQLLAVLPAACLTVADRSNRLDVQTMAASSDKAELNALECCTRCHNADARRLPAKTVAVVASYCQECHTN